MKHLHFTRLFTGLFLLLFTQGIRAQQFLFVENFNGNQDFPPDHQDWVPLNNSQPEGYDWYLGDPGTFHALTGADSSYVAANYDSVDSLGTISNWLLTPELPLANGNVFRFYTRSSTTHYADRMQVYLSQAGGGIDIGNTATSVGTFSTLLVDINPSLDTANYPIVWTAYTATVSGISGSAVTGRFGFRYFVTNGGAYGLNSSYVGVDSVTYYIPAMPTGIASYKNNSALISLYPNPFKNELTIKGASGKAEFFDVLGKQVLASEFENGGTINTGVLEKGIYMIRISNDTGELMKMMKMSKE